MYSLNVEENNQKKFELFLFCFPAFHFQPK